jgi:hypothetical protein
MQNNIAVVIRRVSTYFNSADAPSRASFPKEEKDAAWGELYSPVDPEFGLKPEEYHDTLNGKFYPKITRLAEIFA